MELEAVMEPTVLTNSLQDRGHTKKSQMETQSAFFGTRAHVHMCMCANMCLAAWVCAMYFNKWMGWIVCVGAVLAGGGVDVGAYSSCYRNIPGIDLWLTVLHLHLSGVSVSSVLGSADHSGAETMRRFDMYWISWRFLCGDDGGRDLFWALETADLTLRPTL